MKRGTWLLATPLWWLRWPRTTIMILKIQRSFLVTKRSRRFFSASISERCLRQPGLRSHKAWTLMISRIMRLCNSIWGTTCCTSRGNSRSCWLMEMDRRLIALIWIRSIICKHCRTSRMIFKCVKCQVALWDPSPVPWVMLAVRQWWACQATVSPFSQTKCLAWPQI